MMKLFQKTPRGFHDFLGSEINESLKPHLFTFGLSLTILLIAYRATWYSLFHKYATSGTYAHGFLIWPIVIWLILRKKNVFQTQARFEKIGLLAIGLASFSWYMADMALVNIVQQLSFMFMLIALFVTCFGFKISRQLVFPLGYALFAIPFGNFLIPTLQNITAFFAIKLLELSNISVFHEGVQIVTSRGTFEVAAACSGIRYLIATISLGVLYAYLTYYRWWKRLLFCLLCVTVPVLANGLRAYLIILLAHLSNMKYAIGIDHLIYGWVFFGLIIAFLFFIGMLWRDKMPEVTQSDRLPIQSNDYQQPLLTILCMAIIIGPLLQKVTTYYYKEHVERSIHFPLGVNGWEGPEDISTQWKPLFLGASQEKIASYTKLNQTVHLYTAHYYKQSEDRELISEKNILYDPKIWSLVDKGMFAFENDYVPSVYEMNIQRQGSYRLVWYWYVIGGVPTANPIWGKLLEGLSHVRQQEKPSMIIAVSAYYDYYPESARAVLEEFIQTMMPEIMKSLDKDEYA